MVFMQEGWQPSLKSLEYLKVDTSKVESIYISRVLLIVCICRPRAHRYIRSVRSKAARVGNTTCAVWADLLMLIGGMGRSPSSLRLSVEEGNGVAVRHIPREAIRTALVLLSLVLSGLATTGSAAGASSCPNRTLTGFLASLPDCRAYEMVTPPYKQDFPLAVGSAISADGSQVLAESFDNFLTPEDKLPEGNGALGHFYRLVRTVAGWESLPVEAPYSRFPNLHEIPSLSPDFDTSLWLASAPGQTSEDIYLDMAGGAVTRVGPGTPPGARETALRSVATSEDLHHLLFTAHSINSMEENLLWPGDTTFEGFHFSLYEYSGTENSEPSLVGINNEGKPKHISESHLISNCGTLLGGGHSELEVEEAYNAVSASGDTVYFTSRQCGNTPPTEELYARIDQEKTVAISEPPLSMPGRICVTEACVTAESVSANRRPGVFAGASLDGSRVFFLTSQPLVDADTDGSVDLYAADINEGKVTRLTQVSRGGEGDPTPGTGAEVLGVARVSEDGSHVYFVAQGVLTGKNGEGKAPVMGEPNLYVFAEECPDGGSPCGNPVDHTSFVATLSRAKDEPDWGLKDVRPVQATPDGRFLVFQSGADITSDQEGLSLPGQVFEYDARTEKIVRISREQNGSGANESSNIYPATIPSQFYAADMIDTRFTRLAMSADGSRVFFTSAAALTPNASAGFSSVYEYHDGHLYLIATGHDVAAASATNLIGTDESGRDVFFTTSDRLTPQDRDASIDVYDARIEGGFEPPAELAPCSGDPCHGAGGTAPSLLAPGVSSGLEEVAPAGVTQKTKAIKQAKKTKKTKKHKRSTRRHVHSRKRASGRRA